jgi:predicted Zn-dependent protease
MADARVRANPDDLRARFARGAASGVRSRHHLFRLHRSDAARTAAAMRGDLLAVREREPGSQDVNFGLGLYDYYADVLPKYARLLRWLARIPGGDRERGLTEIERARDGSVLHRTEAQAQLYEIYAFWEEDPERALDEIQALQRRHPGWPLWGLRLSEHLRERMGAYPEAAAVARGIVAAANRRNRDPGPAAVALARLALGRALLLDLRPAEARRALLPVKDGLPGNAALAAEERWLLGQSLELEGDRDGARAHYRLAVAAGDKDWRKRAQSSLENPLSPGEVRARHAIGEARRHREARRWREAAESYREALASSPGSTEGALGVAEADLRAGRAAEARLHLEDVEEARPGEPPWLVSWRWLLLAQAHDLEGEREAALVQYKKVLKASFRGAVLREAATSGLRAPFHPVPSPGA